MARLISGCTVAALVWLAAAAPSASAQADPGKAAYQKGCEMCHGPDARGAMGPGLVPLIINLADLTKIVRGGLGQMPPLSTSEASDAEVAAMHAYLKRLGGPLTPPTAAAVSAADSDDVNVKVDRARVDHNFDALAAAIESTTATLSELAIAERIAHLAAAQAAWEWVVQHPTPAPQSVKLVDQAIDHAVRAVALNDRVADGHAFVAALCALRLTLGSGASPTLSSTIVRELDRAKALDADGPRVLLLAGITAVLAPAAAGGLDAADRQLRRAQELLPAAATGFVWPAWTSADAVVWRGRALQQRGDHAGARAAYEEALRLRPRDRWITEVLLPAVTR